MSHRRRSGIAYRSALTDRLLWFVGTCNQPGSAPAAAVADANGEWLCCVEATTEPALHEITDRLVTAFG